MPETTPAPAAQDQSPSTSPAGEPAQVSEPTAAPAATVPDRDELDRLRRYEQQVRGMAPVMQVLSSLGLTKPEDIKAYAPLIKGLRERGVQPDELARMLFASQQEPTGQRQDIDIEQAIEQRLGEFRREQALQQHTSSLESERRSVEKIVDEVVGKDAQPWMKRLMAAYAKDRHFSLRQLYPDDHPLSQNALGLAGEEGLAKLRAELEEYRGYLRGQAAAEIAKASAKATHAPTAAGNRAPQGAPAESDEGDPASLLRSIVERHVKQ